MNRLYVLFLSILVLCMSGCAASRSGNLSEQRFSEFKHVINVQPLGKIDENEKSLKAEISSSSPYIDTDAARGKFEIFEVTGNKGQVYQLSGVAICNCFGFTKDSIVPMVFLLDSAGNLVVSDKKTGATFQLIYGSFPENGKYYFLVVADEKMKGKKIGSLNGPMVVSGVPLAFGTSLPLSASTTGIVFVQWQKVDLK